MMYRVVIEDRDEMEFIHAESWSELYRKTEVLEKKYKRLGIYDHDLADVYLVRQEHFHEAFQKIHPPTW